MKNIFNRVINFKYFYQCLLILVALIGYWQIILMIHPLNYDVLDCTYPWKYFVGECLQNHLLPLWNPYETLGYPIHADPQVGVWYPLTWLIGYVYGYDIYSLHFEFMLHIYFAAIGMFLLGRTLGFSKSVSFFIAVAYMFSGIFIGNSQHYMIIASAAWIPFIINYYIRFSKEATIQLAFSAAFFVFLLISGGYPSYVIIITYFLFFLFLFFAFKLYKDSREKLFRFIKLNFVFVISILLFSAVIFVSAYYVSEYITRGGKLPIATVLKNPFSPQSLLSIMLPFASVKETAFFDTDLSMTNIYFGFIPLIFFISATFKKLPGLYYFFIGFGVIALFASMGGYTPVRTFLYNYVPFMGIFRFPSIFRLFTIIGCIITAGYGLQKFIADDKANLKFLKIIVIIFLLLLIALIAGLRLNGNLNLVDFVNNNLFKASTTSRLVQHIVFQCFVQIFVLGLFLLILQKIKERNKALKFMTVLLICDMIFAAQLNEPYTTFYKKFNTTEIKKHSESFPKGFQIPSTNNVLQNTDIGLGNGPLWRNLNCFHKQIAWDGFTSFSFKSYNYMTDSMPDLLNSSLSNPPVFLSDKVFPEDSMKAHVKKKTLFHKNIYLEKYVFSKINHAGFAGTTGDTAIITSFNPQTIEIKVLSKAPQLLALQQNYYTGWTVEVNGSEATMLTYNKGLMCVEVPAGDSKVVFKYDFPRIVLAAKVSAVSLLLFLLLVLVKKFWA